ncbi:hypothetical protein [Rhizorhabdus argentea]|uniref:hypothetical protein n=1 Tax=Rhizorhabdus argentea TaxID=1387174 RepID=UPI0030ED6CDD
MRRWLISGMALLSLAACRQPEPKPAEQDTSGGPQIATSIDDYALPVDRSAEITAIDAATGDAAGMPKDGGPVIVMPKPEAQPSVEAAAAPTIAAPAPATAAPLVTPPAPPPATSVAGD